MTDHIAEAKEWLEFSGDQNPGFDGKAKHASDLAQVHATLALAEAADAQVAATLAQTEQLRLANVIAWTTGNGYNPSPAVLAAMEKGLGL